MPKPSLRIKLILTFALIILGAMVVPNPVMAQSQAIIMSVEPAFQGYFKYGEWLPVWVNLENNGADLLGEVRVSVTRDFEQVTYAAPVSLPAGARKRLPVYVLPNNFTHELKVDLIVDELALQSQKVVVQPMVKLYSSVATQYVKALLYLKI